jgi:hypothetical protein
MSDPLLERLSRFTPDPGSLDRDALLFAAGRNSARPNRGWKALAYLLASTQALSLLLPWPHSSPSGRISDNVAAVPAPSSTLESEVSAPPAQPGVWSARKNLEQWEPEDRPSDSLTLIDSDPPLRAFGLPRPSLVN